MENKRNGLRVSVAALLVFAMIMSLAAAPVFAAAPSKERVKYLGSGKVEVDFYGDVDYRNSKVTVKDTSGKKYSAYIYDRDDDELKFKINKYKSGKTYKFTISGIRNQGTSKYKSVSSSFKIKKAAKNITASQAKSIAFKNAGVSASQVYDYDWDTDYYRGVQVYEISFKAKGYDYEYKIAKKGGKIMKKDVERDDDYWEDQDDDDDD